MRNVFVLFVLLIVSDSVANNSGISYQGKIVKPDGAPLEGSSVEFRMQIRSPGTENCLLYEEVKTLSMVNSAGVFSITLNDGNGTRIDTPTYPIEKIFSNRATLTLDTSRCSAGTTYAPDLNDGRNFIVYFKDETMSSYEPLPILKLNYVPQALYALESQKVGLFSAANLVRAVDVSGNPVAAPALDPTQLANFNNLVSGTSTQYATASQFNSVQTFAKTVPPTCAAGEVLKSNGTSLSCVAMSTGASYSGITAATGSNSIDNTNYSQTWNWSTATTQSPMSMSANSLTTGSLLSLTTSSSSVNSLNGLLNISNSGTSTSGTLAKFQSNSTAGSGLVILNNGHIGIGTVNPAALLDIVQISKAGAMPSPLSVVGAASSTAGGTGGAIVLTAGAGNGSGTGGAVSITSGAGNGGGGSSLVLNGGSISGSDVSLIAGASGGTGGGSVNIVGGAGTNGYNGGSLTLNGGVNGGGAGKDGNVILANTRGYVGVGTSSPGAMLDVKSTLRLSGSTSGYTQIQVPAAAGSNSLVLPSVSGLKGQVLSNDGAGTLSWKSVPQLTIINRYTGFSALSGTQSNTLVATAPAGLYRMTVFGKNSAMASSGSSCSMLARYYFSSEAGAINTGTIANTLSGTTGGISQGTYTFYHADATEDIRVELQRTAGTCVGDNYRYDVILEQLKEF